MPISNPVGERDPLLSRIFDHAQALRRQFVGGNCHGLWPDARRLALVLSSIRPMPGGDDGEPVESIRRSSGPGFGCGQEAWFPAATGHNIASEILQGLSG